MIVRNESETVQCFMPCLFCISVMNLVFDPYDVSKYLCRNLCLFILFLCFVV